MTPSCATLLQKILMVWLLLSSPPMGAQTRWKEFQFFSSEIGRVEIRAGCLTAYQGGRRILLEEGVRLTGDGLEARADRAEIWAQEKRVVLTGAVKVIEGTSVLLCDRLEFTRPTAGALIHNAVILVKKRITNQQLTGCRTASQLVQAGQNAITLQGELLEKKQESYDIERARFTACDCRDEAPSWEIRSSAADVEPGERAWLTWPVLYLKGIPVFVLPAAYLPLSERRTGLLFPQVNYSGRDGFVLSESFFLTLGDSADTTLSLDWFEERGFRERLEFRARPSSDSRVDLSLMYLRDEKRDYPKNPELDEEFKNRFSLELDAGVEGAQGTSFRSSLRLYSDSDINRHFRSDMRGRALVDAPSVVILEKAGDNLLGTLDLVYRQDLRFGRVDLLEDPAHDTIHRLGAFTLTLAPTRIFDFPLLAAFVLEVANLSSLSRAWRDWGVDGHEHKNELDGEADGVLGDGELRRAVRLRLEPELRLPVQLGRQLHLEPYLGHRQLVYLPHGPQAPGSSTRGRTFAGFRVGTELSRAFGSGEDRIGHLVAPSLRLAGAWRGLYGDGLRHYLDLFDRPFEDAVQLLAGVDNAWYLFRDGWVRFLRLGITQGIDLRKNQISQANARLEMSLRPVSTRLSVYYDWEAGALAELDAATALADSRGDSLRVSYLWLPSHQVAGRPLPLSERTRREDGLLFGLAPAHFRTRGDRVHVLEGRARLQIAWGLWLNAGANLDLQSQELAWYGGGVGYDSDCHCWGFSLYLRMLKGQSFPDIFFLLDLAYLGAAGVGTTTTF